MAAKHKDRMTPEKQEIIGKLIEMYGVQSISDIYGVLKDLLGGTIQEMLEAELETTLGYENMN